MWIQNYFPKLRGNHVISSQGFFCCEEKNTHKKNQVSIKYKAYRDRGLTTFQKKTNKNKLSIIVLGSVEIRLSPGTSTAEVLSKTLPLHPRYYSSVAFCNLLSMLSQPIQCFNALILYFSDLFSSVQSTDFYPVQCCIDLDPAFSGLGHRHTLYHGCL